MFIKVKYGDDQEHIFNPNCKNNILLHYIRKKCHCNLEDILELSNEDGDVKNVHVNLEAYGTDYFSHRETLILLRVEKPGGEEDDSQTYTPLLDSLKDNKEFIEKLNIKAKAARSRARVSRERLERGDTESGGRGGRKTSGKAKMLKRGSSRMAMSAFKK